MQSVKPIAVEVPEKNIKCMVLVFQIAFTLLNKLAIFKTLDFSVQDRIGNVNDRPDFPSRKVT